MFIQHFLKIGIRKSHSDRTRLITMVAEQIVTTVMKDNILYNIFLKLQLKIHHQPNNYPGDVVLRAINNKSIDFYRGEFF